VNTGKLVYVKSLLGNVYLHVSGGNAFNGAPSKTWQYVNQYNLKWEIVKHGAYYYLCSAINPKFVLHQSGANFLNGGAITLWNRYTHGNQNNLRVTFHSTSDGHYLIRFVHSGKYVHVNGASTSNGTPITQWQYVNQNNLKWDFILA